MKRFNKMTDEELAVYLDQINSGERDIKSLKSLDVDSLEVLSVSGKAIKKCRNGENMKRTDAETDNTKLHDGVFGSLPMAAFLGAGLSEICSMDVAPDVLSDLSDTDDLSDSMDDFDDDLDDFIDNIDDDTDLDDNPF